MVFYAYLVNSLKVISGDDDLPTRDDIGERRRKYELQMLARAGFKSKDGTSVLESESDGDEDDVKGNGEADSEDEFYKEVKQQRAAKLAAKAEIYSRYVSIIVLFWFFPTGFPSRFLKHVF